MQIGALSDIKVLDLTRVLSGPFAAMWLGDLGADVIKIETPGVGDDARFTPVHVNGYSTFFAAMNRNKRSVTLNLKTPEGKAMFLEMVRQADVVMSNYRPGVMERLGLSYEELSKINDRIIYATVSGFGQKGVYSQRPAYDIVAQGMGGIMSLTGEEGGGRSLYDGEEVGTHLQFLLCGCAGGQFRSGQLCCLQGGDPVHDPLYGQGIGQVRHHGQCRRTRRYLYSDDCHHSGEYPGRKGVQIPNTSLGRTS